MSLLFSLEQIKKLRLRGHATKGLYWNLIQILPTHTYSTHAIFIVQAWMLLVGPQGPANK
jgi:hypothetical protein